MVGQKIFVSIFVHYYFIFLNKTARVLKYVKITF